MRRARVLAAFAFTLAGWVLPANAATPEEPEASARGPADSAKPAESAAKPTETPAKPGPRPDTGMLSHPPQDANAALIRATAAYEYGDLNQVVEAARLITEGLLPATQEQQAQALRWLGIGLYLTSRPLGAETAFTELLRKDPHARLDPTTTRPELVAFFEGLRRQQLAHQRSARKLFWNFIPPVGQFQNEDNTKGWIILGLGVASAATAVTSFAVYESWKRSDGTFAHEGAAQTFRTVNIVSDVVLIAVYVYGVVDGLVGYGRPSDDSRFPVSLHFFPGGSGLGFTF